MNWSVETQKMTKKIIRELPIENFIQGYCVLKKETGEFARITVNDAIGYKAILREMDSDEIIVSYETIDEIVQNGWVVD
ncbi:MAG: hypothetical protein SFU98_07180 [Leptospiraceae bacterium]|nr:hypothetical protein [Leptospiraceae bacterium]